MNKDIFEHMLCIIAGFSLLCLVYYLTTWELTVVIMFFWLCYKIDIAYYNHGQIIENQKTNGNNQKVIINNQQILVENQQAIGENQIEMTIKQEG